MKDKMKTNVSLYVELSDMPVKIIIFEVLFDIYQNYFYCIVCLESKLMTVVLILATVTV